MSTLAEKSGWYRNDVTPSSTFDSVVILPKLWASIVAEMQDAMRSPESCSPSSKRKPSHSGSACSLAADSSATGGSVGAAPPLEQPTSARTTGTQISSETLVGMSTTVTKTGGANMKGMTPLEHPLATALEREHREIDSGIEQYAAADDGDTSPLLGSLAGLRRHIYLEEKFLFPPLREAGLMMPILVMLREHGDLWRSMDALESLIADGAARDTVTEACRELLGKLDKHNLK